MRTMKVKTRSGSRYVFEEECMTWSRENVKPILGIPLMSDNSTFGVLVEWPVVILGRGMTFDDRDEGVVYTTPVVRASIKYDEE